MGPMELDDFAPPGADRDSFRRLKDWVSNYIDREYLGPQCVLKATAVPVIF